MLITHAHVSCGNQLSGGSGGIIK